MADPKPRAALQIETLAAALAQPLEDEAQILEVLVSAMARGQGHEDLWAALHRAAQRDDRLAELAFAYERLARDKKLKALPAPAQASVLAHAGSFSFDIFGDAEGAEGFLERALTLAPGDLRAFEKYERLLRDRKDLRRLGELYASAAPHRGDRGEQLALLRRGAEAVDGDPERAVKLHAEILRLEPLDEAARRALVDLYDKTGRFAELARLLEQSVGDGKAVGDGRDAKATHEARGRLVALYAGPVGDIERALPHVEELLRAEPAHPGARRVAEELLSHKSVAARAAAALSAAYEAAEEPSEAARILAIELEILRGPKKLEAQKRLARITLEQLGDLDRTFPMYEAIVPLDPADEDVRSRFVQLASAIDKQLEAARTLSRIATSARDPALKARINGDLGDLYRELGDARKARGAYQAVLDARADDDATLRAARAMVQLAREPRDPKGLVAALTRLAEIEPTEAARVESVAELAHVADEDLADPAAAIAAYERLVCTEREQEAIVALARLYDAVGKIPELVGALDRLVTFERDVTRARELAFRAADLRGSRLADRAAAIAAWRGFAATYGASREVLARLAPLLEAERRWDELAEVLTHEIGLAPVEERSQIHARLGHLLFTHRGDAAAALQSFAAALALDPSDRTSRAGVEELLESSELGLTAARVLEPLVRAELSDARKPGPDASASALVRLLEARAKFTAEVTVRLASLAEATEILHARLGDDRRALEFAARGLHEAAEHALGDLPAWLDRVDALTKSERARRVAILRAALGDRALDHPALQDLTRRTAAALAEAGDADGALGLYRRALTKDPASPELVAAVDGLLRARGAVDDRLALHRTALTASHDPAQRRDLRHALAAIELADRNDPEAALATYREAIAEDPSDRAALAAVLDILERAAAWEELYAELGRAQAGAAPGDRRSLLARAADLAARRGWTERAATDYAALLVSEETPTDATLAAAESVARARGDLALHRVVLERRLAAAIEPTEEIVWYRALAELARDGERDAERAAELFRQAAASAELAGDRSAATAALESLLALAPRDRAAASRLLRAYEEAEAWERVVEIQAQLVRTAETPEDASRAPLALERVVPKGNAGARLVAEAEALLASEGLDAATIAEIRSARARTLGADPASFVEATLAYRSLLEDGADPNGRDAKAFEALLRTRGDEGVDLRRWLLELRTTRSSAAMRRAALAAWAHEEETTFADGDRAIAIYERMLLDDPSDDDALAAIARLHAAQGRHTATAEAIERRRAFAEGAKRVELEMELAELLLGPLGRADDAIASIAAVLDAEPSHGRALELAVGALDGPARVPAAEIVERAAARTRDPEQAQKLLHALLATPSSDDLLSSRRRAWFARALELPGLSREAALALSIEAATEAPLEIELWDRVEELVRETKTPAQVAAAYARVLATASGIELLKSTHERELEALGRKAVEFHEEWFEDEETVVALLQRAMALSPASSWAFERLKLIFNLGERWSDLFSLYDGAIASAHDDATRRELLEDAALAAKDLASDVTRATRYYEELYRLAPDARVRTSLQRLYERSGKHRALIDLLEAELTDSGSDPVARRRAHARIAQLWLESAGEPARALAAIERVVAADPTAEESLELLERFLKKTAADEASNGSRARAAALLRDRYKLAGRSADLARVLRVELAGASNGAARRALLEEIAELARDHLHDDALAFEAVEGLFAIDPTNEARLEELGRLADRLGSPARFAEALMVAADTAEAKTRVALLGRAAEVFEGRLDDRTRAVEVHRRILATAGDDESAGLRAARRLAEIVSPDDDARVEAMEAVARLSPARDERELARKEVARLALRCGDFDRAITALSAALVDRPDDTEAESGLAAALEQAGRFADLVGLIERRATRLGPSPEARAELARAATLRERDLDDPEGAIAAWIRLREAHGSDEASTDALAALLDRAGRTDDLIALLESEATATSSNERAAALWTRAGDLHRTRREEVAEAIAAYDLALEHLATHGGARRGLEATLASLTADGVVADPESRAGAVASLTRLYRAAGDHDALAAFAAERLAVAASDRERLSILHETARLHENAGDLAAALDLVLTALDLAPAVAIAADAARLAEAVDGWLKVQATLERRTAGGRLLEASIFGDLSRALAAWRVDRGDLSGAEETLLAVLPRTDDGAEPILSALADVQRRTASPDLVDTLLRLSHARGGELASFRDAAEAAERLDDGATRARELSAELLDRASQSFDDPGAAQAAAWAIEALVRLAENKADRSEWLLRGASLPFAPPERRRLRVAAAALAEGDAQVALYEELVREAPDDLAATHKLEQLYRALDRRDDLLALRERQLERTATVDERGALRLDLAALRVQGGDSQGAIAALRENLREGFDGATTQRLVELYHAGGHDLELVALLEDRGAAAERSGDHALALHHYTTAAEVAEARLGDAARAIAAYRRASALGSPGADDALARLLVAREDHAGAAEVLERICDRLEAVGGPAFSGAVLRLVDTWRAAGQLAAARDRLEQAARRESLGGPLRQRLIALLREAGAWRPLADRLADDAAETEDPTARAALLREAADILLARCAAAAAAIPLLEEAAGLARDEASRTTVQLDLAAARRSIGDLDGAAEGLRALVAAYGARRPKERARVHYELAQVDLARGERARAIGELDAALRIDPAHAEALHALARVSLEAGQLERAARTYRALLLVVKRPSTGKTHEVSRAEVLFELAEIARLRGESDRATEQLESAFEAARESEGELDRLVSVLRTRARHDLLARALEKRITDGVAPGEASAIQAELADLYEHHLGRPEEALEARLASLSHGMNDPNGPETIDALLRAFELARRANQVERYVTVVTRFAEQERDDARALRLHLSLARALEHDLRDDARAAAAYRKAEAIAAAPLVPDAEILGSIWRSLSGIYPRLGDAAQAEALLDRMIHGGADALGPGELASALYQLAELRFARTSSIDSALELLDRALSIAPDPARAAALLRGALAQGAEATQIGRALEHVARTGGDLRLLVEALVVLAEAEPNPIVAAETLREATDVANDLGDAAVAEQLYRRALALAEAIGDGPIEWALHALSERRLAEGALLEAADLRERAARAGDPSLGRAILLEVAKLAAGPLEDLPRAARLYEEVNGREPGDREVWGPLAEVHRRTGDRARLAALLDEVAPLLEDPRERGAIHLERAKLAMDDAAPDHDKAVTVLRDLLEDVPSHAEAAHMLAELLERLGRREELATLVRAQLDAAKDRGDRALIVSLALRLGALLEEQWDEQGALDAYQGALEWEPKSVALLRQVVRVGAAREDSQILADGLDALLGVAEPSESVELALRLATIRAAHDDLEAAIVALEKGAMAAPDDPRIRAELTRRYTDQGDFAKLAALAVRDAEALPSNAERVRALRDAAELLREKGLDPRGAAEILARALELDPSDRAVLHELVSLFTDTSQDARAVDAVSRALEASPDDATLYRLRATLAEGLGRDLEALADLEQAYRLRRDDYVVDLVDALRRAASAGATAATPEDRDAVLRVRLRLAGVLAQSGEIDEARRELTDLLDREGPDRTALRALGLLEEAQGDWEAAASIYLRLAGLETGEGLVDAALRLADASERLERLSDAREPLERALQAAPDEARVRQRLRDLYNIGGHRAELASLLLDDAARAPDADDRFTRLMQAGRLLMGSEAETDRVIRVFDEARALRPDDAEATLLLADANTIAGRLEEARAVLDSVVASQRGRRTRALGAVHRRLARLDLALGDSASALAALSRAFDNDPQNAQLAMELGTLAVELEEHEPATRAFRAVTLMKVGGPQGSEAATPALRALAYYHLGRMAYLQGDRRKARLMIDKAVADDPTLEEARTLLDQLRPM